jgi:hypothetical protein
VVELTKDILVNGLENDVLLMISENFDLVDGESTDYLSIKDFY